MLISPVQWPLTSSSGIPLHCSLLVLLPNVPPMFYGGTHLGTLSSWAVCVHLKTKWYSAIILIKIYIFAQPCMYMYNKIY